MKISQKDLENVIKEEVGGALEEGPFSKAFNKAMQGLKTRNVAKQDKEMGIQRTTVKPEKQQSIDKFMDPKTKKAVVRISAEILSDPSVKLEKTKALKQIDAKKSLGAKGRSKWDIFREEEQLNEATPKEINLYSKLINQAIEDKKMTLEDLLDDVLSLADTNPVVNAIAGVEDLKRFKQKAQPEAAPEEPKPERTEKEKEELFQKMSDISREGPPRPAGVPDTAGGPARTVGPAEPPRGERVPSAEEPGSPDITGAPPAREISPEQEEKAKQAADNIMGAIAGAINSTKVSPKAKRKVKASTEKIRQAIGREIRAGLQEQKDRWQKLAGILKD